MDSKSSSFSGRTHGGSSAFFVSRSSFMMKKTKSYVLSVRDVRRIGRESAHIVKRQIDEGIIRLFGNIDIDAILYEAASSMGVFNELQELVGMVSVDSFPNVPSIPSWSWTEWVTNLYGLEGLYAYNTAWIHLFACDRRYVFVFLRTLLQYYFQNFKYLKHVVLVVPPGITAIEFIEAMATRVLPIGYTNAKRVQTLYLFLRQDFVTAYKLRRAVVEDNDDLVPLIDSHCDRFKKIYGEYYIAELLTSHEDGGRQLIVAEHAGYAQGVVCLNEVVNYDVLNEEFEVAPYCGFKKFTAVSEESYSISNSSLFGDEQERQYETEPEVSTGLRTQTPSIANVQAESAETLALSASRSNIGSFDSEEEDSEEDFEIITVSSAALMGILRETDDKSFSLSSEGISSDFNMNAQFDELCTQLYSQKVHARRPGTAESDHRTINLVKTLMEQIPIYEGEENAFCLEIAAAPPEHEQCLDILLEGAFECFPERDYCLLSVPTTVDADYLVRRFVRVPHRSYGSFPHELYVLHRNAIAGRIRAYKTTLDDTERVSEFVSTQYRKANVMRVFMQSVTDQWSEYTGYVLRCEELIVGLALISEDVDIEFLYNHFEFAPYVERNMHKSGSYGMIDYLLLSPIFQMHGRFFVRELHRLGNFSLLFYKLSPPDASGSSKPSDLRPIHNLLHYMLPLYPRRIPKYDEAHLEECMPALDAITPTSLYAMYLSTPRTASMRRIEINTKIVVVGAGKSAVSFLESLVCTKNKNYQLIFTNVTVVSPMGLPHGKVAKKAKSMFFVETGYLSHRHMEQYNLRTFVNVAQGVMTSIDRKEKLIAVNEDAFLRYDLLFLMCGEQFQRPTLPPVATGSNTIVQKRRSEAPDNFFVLNTFNDAGQCLSKLKATKSKYDKKLPILVYGHFLECYCAIAGLLAAKIPGKSIVYIDPFPDYLGDEDETLKVSVFNDGDVEDCVLEKLKEEGVTFHESFKFVNWTYDSERNLIQNVQFETKYRFLEVPCQALIMYGRKTVSQKTFMAMTRAGLVFDGRLIIDSNFLTNDKSIYACGTMTKYSRRYYADDMAHRHFSGAEVGRLLAHQIRKKLLPPWCHYEPAKEEKCYIKPPGGDMLVPRFEDPIITYCTLPGKLFYLSVRKPGRVVPLEAAMSKENYGTALITGDSKEIDKQGFFRLHINQYRNVETITCLNREEIDTENLTTLYGRHEKLLNSLIMRFELGLIHDLFDYFREPWTYAIYHDHFDSVLDKIEDLFATHEFTEDGETLLNDVLSRLETNKWNVTAEEPDDGSTMCAMVSSATKIDKRMKESKLYDKIEQILLDYLEDESAHLSMYARPMLVRLMMQHYQRSPMFLPQ